MSRRFLSEDLALTPNLDMVGLETTIREIVLTANRIGVPMSTPRLLHQLEEKGFYLLKSTLLKGSKGLASVVKMKICD